MTSTYGGSDVIVEGEVTSSYGGSDVIVEGEVTSSYGVVMFFKGEVIP